MTNALPGHSAPAVGFEVPLEILAACHGRVQSQCATLRRLAAHLAAHGTDRPAQDAANAVIRYFDTAALDHQDDEERDLFPALRCVAAPAEAVAIRTLTDALCLDHRALEARWQSLRRALGEVAAGRRPAWQDSEVEDFIAAHERHIAREDAELLPLAACLLGPAELDRIGLAMRVRRGVG